MPTLNFTVDPDHDIALLKLHKTEEIKPVAYLFPKDAVNEFHVYDQIEACGAALGHEPITTQGIITFMDEYHQGREYWMSNALGVFGDCLPGHSLISLANNSVKLIKDIEAGDRIWAFGNQGFQKRTVEERVEAGEKRIFKIVTKNRTIRASDNHPFLTLKRVLDWRGGWQYIPIWKQLRQLNEGDWIAVLSTLPNRSRGQGFRFADIIGQDKDPLDFMRFLGCFMGDGYIRVRRGYSYELALCLFDDGKIDKYSDILERLTGKRPKPQLGKGIFLYDKDFVLKLAEMGLETHHPSEKQIPDWILTEPFEYQLAFIEGLLDSDGYVNSVGAWAFELTSSDVVEKTRMMLIHMGLTVSNIFKRTRERDAIAGREVKSVQPSYSFQCYPQRSSSQSAFIQGFNNPFNGIVFQSISSIEEDGVEMTYDLKIGGTHNFFVEGVLVHNSGGSVYRYSDKRNRYEFIGMPALLAISAWGFSGDPVHFMGWFVPITRIYGFLKENHYQFIYDESFTMEQCNKTREEERKQKRKFILAKFGEVETG